MSNVTKLSDIFNPKYIEASDSRIIEDLSEYPEIIPGDRGIKVLDTHKNLQFLLKKFRAAVCYNMMTRRREITLPFHKLSKEDLANYALGHINYLATVNGMPIKQIDDHLNMIAWENPYHPIVAALKHTPWDGVKRLDDFIHTIKAENQEIADVLIKTWMVSAIAACHSESGFSSHGVLTLLGDQGVGKTSWIKKLDPIGCNAVKEAGILDPTEKDSIIGLSRFWIVELGEVDATFRKADIARLKSFITSDNDTVRLHYARHDTKLVRRTVYIATVNVKSFLSDPTGNRRWWTINVLSCDYKHDFDMLQVWAEVYQIWLDGAITYLTPDVQKIVDEANKEFEQVDPLLEQLLDIYDWDKAIQRHEMTATAILKQMGYAHPNHRDVSRVGVHLSALNGKKARRYHGKSLHEVPTRLIPKRENNTV